MNMAPNLDQQRMAVMAPSVIQHPMHAMIAPIGPPPPDIDPQMATEGMGETDEAPAMSSEQPKVTQPTMAERRAEKLNSKLMGDYQKDSDPWGSPDNHPGVMGKIGHGLSMFAQNAQHQQGKLTPREAEEQRLEGEIRPLEQGISENALRGAQTAKTQEETKEEPGKTASEEGLQRAEAGNLESETASRGNPTFSVHDTDAGPIIINSKTGEGQHLSVDGQPVGPKLKLTQSQPIDGPDGKPHTYMLDDKGNKVVDLGVHYERPQVSVNAGEKNLWSVPQPDGTDKVVSLSAGDTIPKGAVSLSGQSSQNAKAGGADVQASLSYANDYLQSGAFTGPGDEALQDQFFNLAKPSTGFRMNQAQIDQLHNMASWMDSWRGKAYHAMNGVWFAPKQRQQIVQTMNDLAKSKGIESRPDSHNVKENQPQHKVGDEVMLNGKQVTIKKIYPDGTFDY